MKDYYDIYYLANKFDFEGATLTEALKKTFANRNRSFTLEQFEQMVSFSGDDAMQKKWAAFCKKVKLEGDYKMILNTIHSFLYLPYKESIIKSSKYKKKWTANKQMWI